MSKGNGNGGKSSGTAAFERVSSVADLRTSLGGALGAVFASGGFGAPDPRKIKSGDKEEKRHREGGSKKRRDSRRDSKRRDSRRGGSTILSSATAAEPTESEIKIGGATNVTSTADSAQGALENYIQTCIDSGASFYEVRVGFLRFFENAKFNSEGVKERVLAGQLSSYLPPSALDQSAAPNLLNFFMLFQRDIKLETRLTDEQYVEFQAKLAFETRLSILLKAVETSADKDKTRLQTAICNTLGLDVERGLESYDRTTIVEKFEEKLPFNTLQGQQGLDLLERIAKVTQKPELSGIRAYFTKDRVEAYCCHGKDSDAITNGSENGKKLRSGFKKDKFLEIQLNGLRLKIAKAAKDTVSNRYEQFLTEVFDHRNPYKRSLNAVLDIINAGRKVPFTEEELKDYTEQAIRENPGALEKFIEKKDINGENSHFQELHDALQQPNVTAQFDSLKAESRAYKHFLFFEQCRGATSKAREEFNRISTLSNDEAIYYQYLSSVAQAYGEYQKNADKFKIEDKERQAVDDFYHLNFFFFEKEGNLPDGVTVKTPECIEVYKDEIRSNGVRPAQERFFHKPTAKDDSDIARNLLVQDLGIFYLETTPKKFHMYVLMALSKYESFATELEEVLISEEEKKGKALHKLNSSLEKSFTNGLTEVVAEFVEGSRSKLPITLKDAQKAILALSDPKLGAELSSYFLAIRESTDRSESPKGQEEDGAGRNSAARDRRARRTQMLGRLDTQLALQKMAEEEAAKEVEAARRKAEELAGKEKEGADEAPPSLRDRAGELSPYQDGRLKDARDFFAKAKVKREGGEARRRRSLSTTTVSGTGSPDADGAPTDKKKIGKRAGRPTSPLPALPPGAGDLSPRGEGGASGAATDPVARKPRPLPQTPNGASLPSVSEHEEENSSEIARPTPPSAPKPTRGLTSKGRGGSVSSNGIPQPPRTDADNHRRGERPASLRDGHPLRGRGSGNGAPPRRRTASLNGGARGHSPLASLPTLRKNIQGRDSTRPASGRGRALPIPRGRDGTPLTEAEKEAALERVMGSPLAFAERAVQPSEDGRGRGGRGGGSRGSHE